MKRAMVAVAVVLFVMTAGATKAQTVLPTGFPPFGSFESRPGVGDSVNRQDLNINFQIPIISKQGRGLNSSFSLVYNSSIWELNGTYWSLVPYPDGSPGWNLKEITGYVTSQSTSTMCHPTGVSVHAYNYVYIEPNGTRHLLPLNITTSCSGKITGTTSGYATDSSGYYAGQFADVITDPSGTQTNPGSQVMDSNGNYMTVSNGFTDSTGNAALQITPGTSSNTYQYQDTTGTYQTITVALQNYNIKTNFGCSNVSEFTGGTTFPLPSSVTLPNGLVYSFTYEQTPGNPGYTTGRLSKITLPNGGYIQYAFGGPNDGINCGNGTSLTRTVNDGTNSYVWQFNSPNGPTTVTAPQMPYDSAANNTVYTFNSNGQETSEQWYQGAVSPSNLLRTINTTWASNSTPATKIRILEDGSTQSEIETSYDNYGNLLSLQEYDFGSGSPGPILRTTAYTYLNSSSYTSLNIMNRVTEKTIADSTGTVQYREDTAYDGTTISPCPTGVPQHDDSGHGCSFTTRGNPTSLTTYTNAAAPSGAEVKNSYYDVFGNVVQAQVDCCQLTTWSFSATTEYAFPDSKTCGASGGPQLTTSYTHNSYTGKLATETDPNNLVTSYSYDSMLRLTSVTRPDNSQVTTSYNDSVHTVTNTNPVDSTHSYSTTQYEDGLGRTTKTSVTDAAQNTYATVQTVYDPVGDQYQLSNPYTSSPQYWTTRQYDALRRKTKLVLQDNSQITYSYSTTTVTATDPAGHQKQNQSDGLGRITVFFDPDPTNNNSLTLQTAYAYSVLDKAATITQGSQTRSFIYDGMGRLTSETHPENGTTNYQYNPFDKLTQRTDNRGVITTYQWDTVNRLQQISYNVGSTGVPATPTVTFAYGTTPSQYNNGLLLSMTDGTGSTTYSYDNMARKTQEAHVINGTSYPVSYQYNLVGKVTSITYPSNRVVQQGYDAIGRLASSASGTTTYFSGAAYNTAFEPAGFNFGNGVTTTYNYSPDRLQLQSASYVNGTNTLFGESYTYGSSGANNGEITATSDSVDSGRNMTYTYDSLDRLSTANSQGSTNYPQWGLSFTYDRYGNRTAQNVTAGSGPSNSVAVSPTTNQITTTGYSYDLNGNMTNDGQNTMVYDAENRAVSAADGSGTATYTYDGVGRRITKTFNSTTTVYVLAGNDSIAEYSNGTLSNEYIRAGHSLLAEYNSGTLTYHGHDHLSIRLNMDANGNDVGEHGHYPFGEDWYVTGTTEKWRFTNYERDSESGNDHATFRYHVNRLGRFLTADPMRPKQPDQQLLNRYSYGGSNPVRRRDPDGLFLVPFDSCGDGNSDDWFDFDPVNIFGVPCSYGDPCNYGSALEDPSDGGSAYCLPALPPPPPEPPATCSLVQITVGPNVTTSCKTGFGSHTDLTISIPIQVNFTLSSVTATSSHPSTLNIERTFPLFKGPPFYEYETDYHVQAGGPGGVIHWKVKYVCNGESDEEDPDVTINCKE